MTREEREISIEYLEGIKDNYIEGHGYERHPLPEYYAIENAIKALEQELKIGRCKDCKWWKDSDGEYRRGCGAESHCFINTYTVHCGEGYCYMFSPKADMREVKE